MRSTRGVVVGAIAVGLVFSTVSVAAAAAPGPDGLSADASPPSAVLGYPAADDALLGRALRRAVVGAGFERLVDYDDRTSGGRARPAAFLPAVDTAVIEIGRAGRVRGVANVLLDRDSPDGYVVDVDRTTLLTTGVEFSQWNLGRWDDPALWAAGPAPGEVLVDPTSSGQALDKQYMAAYPASVLKVMVAYSVLRQVDRGELTLKTRIRFHDVEGRSCAAAPSNPTGEDPPPVADGARDTVAGWLDQMITVSDNFATCVLLQALYDRGVLESSNAHFARIGLPTLRMLPADPPVGSGWLSGTMTMGALDTAKLMLVVAGAEGVLWTTPEGRQVTERVLRQPSRAFFRQLLRQQSFNEVLNPVNLCGSSDAVQGIPSTVSRRWIDPDTGSVVTYDGDLVIDFGYDVRPCVRRAEVRFLHKTGLTYNAGGDAGIVRALPGEGGRRYVVATLSSVGYRFGDPDWARSDPNACEGAPYVCYPRAFGRLGRAIDGVLERRT